MLVIIVTAPTRRFRVAYCSRGFAVTLNSEVCCFGVGPIVSRPDLFIFKNA